MKLAGPLHRARKELAPDRKRVGRATRDRYGVAGGSRAALEAARLAVGAAGSCRAQPVARSRRGGAVRPRPGADVRSGSDGGIAGAAAEAAPPDVRRTGARLHHRPGRQRPGQCSRSRRRRTRSHRAASMCAASGSTRRTSSSRCRGLRCGRCSDRRRRPRSRRRSRPQARWTRCRSSPSTCGTTGAVMDDVFVGLPGREMQWVFDKRAGVRRRASHLSLVSSGATRLTALEHRSAHRRWQRGGRAGDPRRATRHTACAPPWSARSRRRSHSRQVSRVRPGAARRCTASTSRATGPTRDCLARSRARSSAATRRRTGSSTMS